MAEDAAKAEPDATTSDKGGDAPTTFTQEQVNDLIAKEKGKIQSRYEGFDEFKAKAEKLDEIESQNQSELEKLTGNLTKTEEAKKAAESKLLRFEVATEKKVPAEAVDFLSGSTREELEVSADKLLELVKSGSENKEEPDFDGGAREPAPEPESPEQAHNKTLLTVLGIAPK